MIRSHRLVPIHRQIRRPQGLALPDVQSRHRRSASTKKRQHRPRSAVSLFRFHRWLANLRVLEIEEIKSVPYIPISHPFIERLLGTVRHEYLDRVFFCNTLDLTRKLDAFRDYYNVSRVHRSLDGTTPAQRNGATSPAPARLDHYAWRQYCRGLFQIPVAARLRIRHPHV